jgi:VCBS repeat-containing protein
MIEQIAFIDSRVPDIQDLLDGLSPGEQAFVIDGNRDGLDQIASILEDNDLTGLSAISIVGHGAPGKIELGSTVVDDASLANDAAALSAIGASLAPGGSLQLYACDVANGTTGQQFIADLSKFTNGADVAASTHEVGSAKLGGSSTLDASTGPAVTTNAPFTAALAVYSHLLSIAPVAGGGGSTASYTERGSPAIADSGLTVSDAGSLTLAGATVSISSGFFAGDQLNVTSQNGITGSDDGLGTLTLSGNASLAQYQAALDSITFSSTSHNPTDFGTDTSRTVSWVLNDGTLSSDPVTSTVAITAINEAPVVVAGGAVTFTGGSAVTLDSGLTVTDVDSQTLISATVSIVNFVPSDRLNFSNNGTTEANITGAYNSATGTLTLFAAGGAGLAEWQTALESVTFSESPGNPDPTGGSSNATRTIVWLVSDGTLTSNTGTSTVTTVHVAPVLTAGGTVTFTGGGSAVALDTTLTLADVDNGDTLAGATVSIDSIFFLAGDTLNFASQNGITGSYDAAHGVLTLSGTSSIANYQAALQSVTFSESPGNTDPTGGGSDTTRTISWSVNDGSSSGGTSNTGTSTLTTVHVAPVVTAGGTVTFTGGGSAVALDTTLTLADVDSGGTLAGARVSIDSTHFLAGDTLNFASQNGITGSYDAAHGVLTLSGTSSVANYQAALQSVTFSESPGNTDPTGGGSDTTRTISWSVNDGVLPSNTASTGLAVLSSVVTANPDSNHVFAGQTVATAAAHGVLANDTDTNAADHVVVSAVDGLTADVNQLVAGAYGSLIIHADGSYAYTANNTASGVVFDNFTYTASNGHGLPSTSTLTIEVTGANQNYVQVPSGGSATGGFGNTVLDGSAGNATLTAALTFNAHQILIGGAGDTLNAASFGQDTFVFANNFGHETINNFHPALDVIQLQQSQFGSLAAVMADIHQIGADSVLTLDANHVITITNTQHATLTAADFHLV